MRERTTWNRDKVAANLKKVAEDPRYMNQDHIQQQPGADEYVIGGPSEFAEDVAAPNWKVEQGSDGNTKRNEIGMPDFRGDTFTASSREASTLDVEAVHRKAELATKTARVMLKNASEEDIENQALAMMDLSESALTETYTRLAAQQDDGDDEDEDEGQDKEAKSAQQQQDKEGQDQEDEDEGQQSKEAGEVPPQFKENIEKMKDKAKDKGEGQGQDKEAKAAQQQQDKEGQDQEKEGQDQEGQDKEAKSAQQDQQAQDQDKEGQDQEKGQQDKEASKKVAEAILRSAGMDQQAMGQLMGQVQQMVQQAMQQQMAQQQMQQGQQQMQGQMSDDDLMDQMLQDQGQQVLSESDIQMDTPTMDVGDVLLSQQDEAVLGQIFASSQEVQNALTASALNGGGQPAPEGMTRTASTRTVGTRPTAGVAHLGGSSAPQAKNDINELSSLWSSAPDVSKAF